MLQGRIQALTDEESPWPPARPAVPGYAIELPRPRRPLVDATRLMVVRLAAGISALDRHAARRNAWEAVCADRERRRQWEEARTS